MKTLIVFACLIILSCSAPAELEDDGSYKGEGLTEGSYDQEHSDEGQYYGEGLEEGMYHQDEEMDGENDPNRGRRNIFAYSLEEYPDDVVPVLEDDLVEQYYDPYEEEQFFPRRRPIILNVRPGHHRSAIPYLF